MDQTLIAQITPLIYLFADKYQYILIIKANKTQVLNNGYHTYHQTIASCFEEILSYTTKSNLANGENKMMKEIASIVENTVQEIRILFKPFEDLVLSKNANTAHTGLVFGGSSKEKDITPISA